MLVAGVQMSCGPDKTANIEKAENFIRLAAAKGAQLVCLQELFSTHFFPATADIANFQLAENENGSTMRVMRGLAQTLKTWVAASLFEHDTELSGRFFNSVLLVSPSGDIVGRYRKLFMGVRQRNYERYYFTAGNLGVPIFELGDLRVAFNICYDRHFPELARIAALQGAHLLVYPTSSLADPGRLNTYQAEMISRSAENLFFVMGVSRSGLEDDRRYLGQSIIVNPYGKVLASLSSEEDGVVIGDVDAGVVEEARRDLSNLRDLRADVYQRLFDLTSERWRP